MIHFPVPMDIPPGGFSPQRGEDTPRFVVYSKREGDFYSVWIKDHLKGTRVSFFTRHARMGILDEKRVSLKWRWWHTSSPAHRIKLTLEAAQRKADELNHQEMFLDHEVNIGVR